MPIYAEYLRPKKRPNRLSDVVPWRNMLLPGLILQKHQHGLQRSYRVRGTDLEGRSKEEQGALMLQANDVLQRLGGKWVLQSEAQRTRVGTLPPIDWAYTVPALIDEERLADLLQESRETQYFWTLSWQPPQLTADKGLRFFIRGPGRPGVQTVFEEAPSLEEFLSRTQFFMGLLGGVLAQCAPMDEEETLRYLHSCVSDRWHPVGPLASWLDIDHQLCDTALDPAGWYPQLGRWHLRTCSLLAYPARSLAGILRRIEALAIDFRWCTRWAGMERHMQEGILKGIERAWVGEETTFFEKAVAQASKEDTRVRNTSAILHAERVDAARQELGMGVTAYGEFTGTITVWDEDPRAADSKRRAVMETLANAGFTAMEETIHQTAAYLSSIPGDRWHNVHKSIHNALTLAHFAPGLSAMWPGPARDDYLQGGPWFYAETEGSSLFRVVNHLRDLGHFLVLGTTGSGKSTLGNFMRAQWMQYLKAQAKVFDMDGHARLLTYLLGGHWHDLGSPSLRLQPLRHCADPRRFSLLLNWLMDVIEEQGCPQIALAQKYVSGGLRQLALRPPAQRTFSELLSILTTKPKGYEHEVHSHRVRVDANGQAHVNAYLEDLDRVQMEVLWVLKRFATGGDHHGIFDGTDDVLVAHPVQTFELRDLVSQPRLLGPVMRYAMLEVTEQMSTAAPMLLFLDDAAIAWLAPKASERREQVLPPGRVTMEQQADDWLQTTRKKAASIGISTHSVKKILESPLGTLIMESCKFRYYLPHAGALDIHSRKIYEELGLTETAIRRIATARPQRDVLFAHEELGMRMLSIPHSRFALDCFARNSAEDHALMNALLAREGREGFAAAWMRHHGHLAAAARLEKEGVYAGASALRGTNTGRVTPESGAAWATMAGAPAGLG